MDEPFGEYKHITLIELLGEELVWVGGDKTNIEFPFEHRKYLCGTWVGVWWILTRGCIVNAGQ